MRTGVGVGTESVGCSAKRMFPFLDVRVMRSGQEVAHLT